MAIADPFVPNVSFTTGSDHSLAQTWTVATSGCTVQTVETGWSVDYGVNGDGRPHVFIFSTASTYGSITGSSGASGCWNNVGGAACVPWVQFGSDYPPGAALPTWSTPNAPQQEIEFATRLVTTEKSCILLKGEDHCKYVSGWQISYSAYGGPWEVMGYYPVSAFGSGPLATGATTFQIGSEVFSEFGETPNEPPAVQMGESVIPAGSTNLYASAAYFHDFGLYNPSATTAPAKVTTYVGVGESSETCAAWGSCLYASPGFKVGDPAAGSAWSDWWYYGDAY